MRYTYDVYNSAGVRFDTTTNLNEIDPDKIFKSIPSGYVVLYDNTRNITKRLNTMDDFEEWHHKLERDAAWKPPVNEKKQWDPFEPLREIQRDNINPVHYKEIVPGMQYMEMMQYMLPDIESHLLGQVYKYLMRNGKKDDTIQELRKALWYLEFLIAYKKNGKKPIKIGDIPMILGEK